jgi:hypothetical protein
LTPCAGGPWPDGRGNPAHIESDCFRFPIRGFRSLRLTDPLRQRSTIPLAGEEQRPRQTPASTRGPSPNGCGSTAHAGQDPCGRHQGFTFDSVDVPHPVAELSPKTAQTYPARTYRERDPPDRAGHCGAKANILRCLVARKVKWSVSVEPLPFGLDYDACSSPTARYPTPAQYSHRASGYRGKQAVLRQLPGNQQMALLGSDTSKLPYGHRARTKPSVSRTKRCYTPAKHGYAVRGDTFRRTGTLVRERKLRHHRGCEVRNVHFFGGAVSIPKAPRPRGHGVLLPTTVSWPGQF